MRKIMTQKKLNKVLEDHEAWLENPKEGKCADLSYCYLAGLKFGRRTLR